jgi:hypothetical protein
MSTTVIHTAFCVCFACSRSALKSQIAKVEKRAKESDASLPPGALQRLEKMSHADRAEISSFGVQQIFPGDVVSPAE